MLHPHQLCQLELHSENLSATLLYLAAVFGWKSVPITLHEYVVIEVPDDSHMGISVMQIQGETPSQGRPPVIPYFRWEKEAIEELLERSEAQGGRLVWGPRPVPAYGQLYLLEEPGGIQIGIFVGS